MKKAFYWIKSTVLFLVGVVLVVWGYQTNKADAKKVGGTTTPTNAPPTDDEMTTTSAPTGDDATTGASHVDKGATAPAHTSSTGEPTAPASPANTMSDAPKPADDGTYTNKHHRKHEGTKAKGQTSADKQSDMPTEKKEAPKTVIETDKKAEEASGTH